VGLPEFRGDGKRLVHVILELVWNAAAAVSGPENHIDLKVFQEGIPQEIVIEVRAAQPGVDLAGRDCMQNPVISTRGAPDAPGVGLAVVARIVEDYGGRLSIESNPVMGICVRARLPVAVEEPDR
jgi:C4-dicarboxylate-specific signal transduction histidine kinase